MEIVFSILLAVLMVSYAITTFKWQKSLERREKTIGRSAGLLEEALKAQAKQLEATEHMLKGQKLRFFALNKQATEIEKTLEEIKKIDCSKGIRKRR